MVEVQDRVEAANVSLYPSDWSIIDAADINRAGRSATLRRIIREWNEWRSRFSYDARVHYDAGCADG